MRMIALIVMGSALLAADNPPVRMPAEKPKTAEQLKAEAARDRQNKKSAAEAAAARATRKPEPSIIPTGAVLVEPNLYRYTDAQGKSWLYRRTPFGASKWEDNSPSAAPAPAAAPSPNDSTRVTDLGDKVQFERPTPFGTTKWVKNKTDLTDAEKALLAPGAPASSSQSQALEGK